MLTKADAEYLNIIDDIDKHGEYHNDRTGVGTKRVFGRMFKFNLEEEFPAITCKPIAFKNTVKELIWFLSGSVAIKDLKRLGGTVYTWWEPFKQEDGTIGPMYGRQLRNYNGQGLDQVKKVIYQLKEEKESRRILMTTYNPIEADLGSLYVCHGLLTQWLVDKNNKLHMSTIQRSADTALGLPHNWVSYAILQIMIARVCNLIPGELTYFVNDLHIYSDHLEPMLAMPAKSYSEPYVEVDNLNSIDEYTLDNIRLYNYKAGPRIKLKMAV